MARGSDSPPVEGTANITLDNDTLSATGAVATASAAAPTAHISSYSTSADLTLLLRRASHLGRSPVAGATPYVSFHSLFAALLTSDDPCSRWVQSKEEWTGFSRARFLARWGAAAPDLPALDNTHLAHAARLGSAELPAPGAAQVSPSAATMQHRAAKLRAELDENGPLAPLHLLAAYLYTPPEEHAEDLAAWPVEREAWAARLWAWAVEQQPAAAARWQALHERTFPRPNAGELTAALAAASALAAEAGKEQLDDVALLHGMVAAGRAEGGNLLVGLLGAEGVQALAVPEVRLADKALPLSGELAAVWARAHVLAVAQQSSPPRLELAHVLAALLLDRRSLPAFARLRQARRTPRGLAAQLRTKLAPALQQEQRDRLRRVFEEHRGDQLAGYHNDESHGEDLLDISADVRALASVLASTKVSPPLSVGLFGDWGSGKSFFMRKLRERIEVLEGATHAVKGQRESWFCGRVVQLDFNAWHYMDADLWSSLAVRIFDGLAENLEAKDRDGLANACLAHLSSVEEREAQLGEERQKLAEQQEALARELTLLQARRQTRELSLTEYVAPLPRLVLERVKKDPVVSELVTRLGIPLHVLSAQAELVKADAAAALRQAPKWWSMFSSGTRLWALLGVLAAAVVTAWAAGAVKTYLPAILSTLGTFNAIYAAGYGKFRSVVQARTKDFDTAVNKVRDIEDAVRAEKSKEEKIAEAELAQHTARLAELEREQLALAQRKAALEAELTRLQEGDARTLRQLILERASASDYRKNLGVISSVHRDFRELAQLLDPRRRADRQARAARRAAQRRALRQERDAKASQVADASMPEAGASLTSAPGAALLSPAKAAPASAAGVPPSDPPAKAAPVSAAAPDPAAQAPEPLHLAAPAIAESLEVDRIILYIDDLDRCPPRRVVEVLQAIHILLSLPLFVVVVAVDSRWLLDSLKKFYLEQFPSDTAPAEAARPQQYLEKIFQVPYTLWPMSDRGYSNLVGAMFGALEPAAASAIRTRALLEDSAPAAPAAASPPRERSLGPALALRTAPADEEGLARAEREVDLTPLSLELEPAELEYLRSVKISDLLPSPRTAKRLVNLYRIVRASLDDDELSHLLSGWYRHVQVCLAITLGHPAMATELFSKILGTRELAAVSNGIRNRIAPVNQEPNKTTAPPPDARERKVLRAMLEALEEVGSGPDVSRFQDTVRRAARFSFETGRLLSMFPDYD